MTCSKLGLYAAGDNEHNQIFASNSQVASNFVFCSDFTIPFYQIAQVCAWEDKFTVLHSNNTILFKSLDGNDPKTFKAPCSIVYIQLHQNSILGLDSFGHLFNVTESAFLLPNVELTTISSSSKFIAGIRKNDKSCILIPKDGSKPQILTEKAICVGCTDSSIYVSTKGCLFSYENHKLQKIDNFEKTIVQISCSETEALFLDDTGKMYQFNNTKPILVYGVPSIAKISVGTQHFAAISTDGRLFTWGFNPSCQLGTGNDRASLDPIQTFDGVSAVTCGVHNTWVLRNGKLPTIPKMMQNVQKNEAAQKKEQNNLYSSEKLVLP